VARVAAATVIVFSHSVMVFDIWSCPAFFDKDQTFFIIDG
jgi:hypothetical protein